MTQSTLTTDYLIIGSGATGMAFADVIFHETNARMVIVDRHHCPGGHWNDAYPFVRLHQPSAYYGVNSMPLGSNKRDQTGLNVGMYERATNSELVSYYGQLMQKFVDSGRVQYFPMSDYVGDWLGEHRFRSVMSGEETEVTFTKKIVDTTFFNTSVPSTHPPKYEIAEGVQCVPLNALPRLWQLTTAPTGFVVIGAGKTGVDACLWLLENGTNPDHITWIMPRDAWFLNRANVQPGLDFFEASFGSFANQMEIIAGASSSEEVFAKLEAAGVWLRLDKSVEPSMFHGALMSKPELELLSKIKNVVRMGRIVRIEENQIVLEKGSVPSEASRLYVDCSSNSLQQLSGLASFPIFQGNKITPQFVRTFQPTFSTAFIAHIESNFEAIEEKNKICGVVPLPDKPIDWLKMHSANLRNQYVWSKYEGLPAWNAASRLEGFGALAMSVDPQDTARVNLLRRYGMNAGPAAANIGNLLAKSKTQTIA